MQVSERYALLVAGKGARLRQLKAWLTAAAGPAPGLLALDEAPRARRGSAAGAASLALQAPSVAIQATIENLPVEQAKSGTSKTCP